MLALQKTTHHTLHALGAALADLNLSAAEIDAAMVPLSAPARAAV